MKRIATCLAGVAVAAAMSGGIVEAQQSYPAPADMQTYYIYFLTKGPNYGRGTPEEQKDIQGKHMAHLGSLGASIAGPFGTEGPRRGLVILKAASLAEARAKGEADPAVKAGTFTVEIYTLVVPRNWFELGPVPEPYQMRRFVFVIFDRAATLPAMGPGELPKLEQGHLENLYRLSREGKLDIAGPLVDGGVHRGIAVMRTDTIEEAREWLASDPLVKAGVLTITPLQWFAADGIMLRR